MSVCGHEPSRTGAAAAGLGRGASSPQYARWSCLCAVVVCVRNGASVMIQGGRKLAVEGGAGAGRLGLIGHTTQAVFDLNALVGDPAKRASTHRPRSRVMRAPRTQYAQTKQKQHGRAAVLPVLHMRPPVSAAAHACIRLSRTLVTVLKCAKMACLLRSEAGKKRRTRGSRRRHPRRGSPRGSTPCARTSRRVGFAASAFPTGRRMTEDQHRRR